MYRGVRRGTPWCWILKMDHTKVGDAVEPAVGCHCLCSPCVLVISIALAPAKPQAHHPGDRDFLPWRSWRQFRNVQNCFARFPMAPWFFGKGIPSQLRLTVLGQQEMAFLSAAILSLANCARYSSLLSLAEFNLPQKKPKQGIFHQMSEAIFGGFSNESLEESGWNLRPRCQPMLVHSCIKDDQTWSNHLKSEYSNLAKSLADTWKQGKKPDDWRVRLYIQVHMKHRILVIKKSSGS